MNTVNPIDQFSQHLLWDVDRSKLDMEKNSDYIVKKVLEYGLIDDWRFILKYYGIKRIAEIAKTFRELDEKSLYFISYLSDTPVEEFRCYNTQPSQPQHWNF